MRLSQDVISCCQPIDMNLYLIKNVKVNRFDAVNKAYVDRVKYKTATGIIPNIVMTDLHSSHCESFCQWENNNM